MDSRIVVAIAALVGLPACGATEESSEASTERDSKEETAIVPQSFVVELDRTTTAEEAIPQLLKAARHQLAAACADYPMATIRVFNPLASGAYTDVPCASVLSGNDAAGEASAALMNDEVDGPIGTAQQRWSPFGLTCSILTIGSGLVANWALCPRVTNRRDERRCRIWSDAGFSSLGFLCFLF